MVAFSTAIVDIFTSVSVDVLGEALSLSARGAGVSVAASWLIFFQNIFTEVSQVNIYQLACL